MKPLVMNPTFFLGSLIIAFLIAFFNSLFFSFSFIIFAAAQLTFGQRVKIIEDKFKEVEDGSRKKD